MPVPQLKPLLPSEVDSSFGSQSSSSQGTTSSGQQTVTYRPSIKIKKEEPGEMSKANSVYSFEPKIYNQNTPIKIEKPDRSSNSFFSGLDHQVKVRRTERPGGKIWVLYGDLSSGVEH